MYEFYKNYSLDLDALTIDHVASGVHLDRDVSLYFSFQDPLGNNITNDAELRDNPFITNTVYDILSSSGTTVYANYTSGKSRYFNFRAEDNIGVFGFYQKDFGIRANVYNSINTQVFRASFYLYGNIPSINSINVYDGTTGAISGGSGVYNKIQLNINYNNNLNYIKFNRIDVYTSTEDISGKIFQPSKELASNIIANTPYYLYSLPIFNQLDASIVNIPSSKLRYNIPYYFGIVPYSEMGSGEARYFGPNTMTKEFPTLVTEKVLATNILQLNHGASSMIMDYITGFITGASNTNTILDTIPKSLYSTITYTAQVSDANLSVSSSELKFVITSTGSPSSGVSFSEYAISDNNYPVYSYTNSDDYVYLNVSGVAPTGVFKLYKVAL
jgi:hypothetical protein